MTLRWVVNASPVIILARIGRAQLLESLPATLVIPDRVAAEIERGPEASLSRLWLSRRPQLILDSGESDPEVLRDELGPGESAVLTWARRNAEFEALLDDAAARRTATRLGLRVRGTLGVLVLAKRAGLIDSVRAALDQSVQVGLRTHPNLYRAALESAGEPPES